MKQFCYCVNSRGPLTYLAELTSDDSDGVALLYNQQQPGYLYFPNSTTNSGRNRLFEEVKDKGYEYLVIMDDDVTFEAANHEEGFRTFEGLVNEYHPAVATPRYQWHLKGGDLDVSKAVQGLVASDACMNAFHRDVWWTLLPYWTGLDDDNWWNAAQILTRIASILYPGSFVQLNEIGIINGKSEAYPRGDHTCKKADVFLLEMLHPWCRHLLIPYADPRSFKETPPVLRDSYKLTRHEVGRYFDMMHPYWKDRQP